MAPTSYLDVCAVFEILFLREHIVPQSKLFAKSDKFDLLFKYFKEEREVIFQILSFLSQVNSPLFDLI